MSTSRSRPTQSATARLLCCSHRYGRRIPWAAHLIWAVADHHPDVMSFARTESGNAIQTEPGQLMRSVPRSCTGSRVRSLRSVVTRYSKPTVSPWAGQLARLSAAFTRCAAPRSSSLGAWSHGRGWNEKLAPGLAGNIRICCPGSSRPIQSSSAGPPITHRRCWATPILPFSASR
jgi:hypothetical protein